MHDVKKIMRDVENNIAEIGVIAAEYRSAVNTLKARARNTDNRIGDFKAHQQTLASQVKDTLKRLDGLSIEIKQNISRLSKMESHMRELIDDKHRNIRGRPHNGAAASP